MRKLTPPDAALSDSQIEGLLAEISDLALTRSQLEADMAADLRALDERLLPIKEEFRVVAEQKAKTLEAVCVSIDERTGRVTTWANAHKAERFGSKRSIELLHGIIGFRLSKPRVAERPRRTFARAAYWLSIVRWGRKYLRPATVNKEAILKDRAALEARPERLRRIGLVIVQDDELYIHPKRTHSDNLPGQKTSAS